MPSAARSEESLLFHYPHYGQGPAQNPQSALILINYKLLRDLETKSIQLFDLETDLFEENDLSKKMPEKAEQIVIRLGTRLKQADVQMPEPNPNYDPNADSETTRRRK